jgi:hypothetical protein
MGTLGATARFYRPLASPVWRRCYLGVLAAYIALAIWLYVKYEILLNMLYHLGTLFITCWVLGKAARRLGLLDTDHTNVARSSTRGSALRHVILLALILAQAGCGSTTTVREVQGSAAVIQQGRAIPARADLPLKTGDELQTEPASTVILHFPGSDEVYVLSQTRVRIDSIFVFHGEIFVRAKGRFAVKTEFATAGVEGTEFWVSVDAKSTVSVGVFKGRVRLESRTGLWRPVRVTRNEVFRIPQEQPPSKDPNPQDDLDRIRQLIEEIDKRRTRVARKGQFIIPVVIGAVVTGVLGPLLPWPVKSPGRRGPSPGVPSPRVPSPRVPSPGVPSPGTPTSEPLGPS